MAVVVAIFFYVLLQVDDVSAQTSCVISPNITTLTIANGLTQDVEFHCQCIDDNGMMIIGTRWLLSNGNLAPTQNFNIPPAVLLIARPFDDTDAGTYICSPNNMQDDPSRDIIMLSTGTPSGDLRICNIDSPSITTDGGVMYIANATQNVILYCLCWRNNVAVGPARWFIDGTPVTRTTASGNIPYSRNNNVPAPLIIPLFTVTSAGTYGCASYTDVPSVTIDLAISDCVISPDITTLTIVEGLQQDVEFHCQCIDGNGMIITGTRWFHNGRLVLTKDDIDRQNNAPYYIDTTPTTLYIDAPFTASSHSGTFTCSPNDIFPAIPPGDSITINVKRESLATCNNGAWSSSTPTCDKL